MSGKKDIYKSKIKDPLKNTWKQDVLPGAMGRVGNTWQDLFTESDVKEIKLEMSKSKKK